MRDRGVGADIDRALPAVRRAAANRAGRRGAAPEARARPHRDSARSARPARRSQSPQVRARPAPRRGRASRPASIACSGTSARHGSPRKSPRGEPFAGRGRGQTSSGTRAMPSTSASRRSPRPDARRPHTARCDRSSRRLRRPPKSCRPGPARGPRPGEEGRPVAGLGRHREVVGRHSRAASARLCARARPRRHGDDAVEIGIAVEDAGGVGKHQRVDGGVRPGAAQAADQRRGQQHVAEPAQRDHQNARARRQLDAVALMARRRAFARRAPSAPCRRRRRRRAHRSSPAVKSNRKRIEQRADDVLRHDDEADPRPKPGRRGTAGDGPATSPTAPRFPKARAECRPRKFGCGDLPQW